MTGRRMWVIVPAMVVVAIGATIVSAYAGSQAAAAPQATANETATEKANREAFGKAVLGPWAYSGSGSYTFYIGGGMGRSPEQPIRFPHPVHVNSLQMNCTFCHNAAGQSPDPGLPAVGTCMGCHTIVGAGRPEIVKLAEYATKKQPIPWVRVHKVPEYVHFPHMRHVNAGVTCQTCHGQVNNMAQVFQAQSLNMGWCVTCHVQGYSPADGVRAAGLEPDSATLAMPRKRANYDCATCHY